MVAFKVLALCFLACIGGNEGTDVIPSTSLKDEATKIDYDALILNLQSMKNDSQFCLNNKKGDDQVNPC